MRFNKGLPFMGLFVAYIQYTVDKVSEWQHSPCTRLFLKYASLDESIQDLLMTAVPIVIVLWFEFLYWILYYRCSIISISSSYRVQYYSFEQLAIIKTVQLYFHTVAIHSYHSCNQLSIHAVSLQCCNQITPSLLNCNNNFEVATASLMCVKASQRFNWFFHALQQPQV